MVTTERPRGSGPKRKTTELPGKAWTLISGTPSLESPSKPHMEEEPRDEVCTGLRIDICGIYQLDDMPGNIRKVL